MTSLTPIVRPVASADAGAGVFLQREPHEAGAIRRHPAGDGAIDELELLPIQAQGHDLRRELPVRWRSCHDDLPVTRTLSCTQEWMGGNASSPVCQAILPQQSPKLSAILAQKLRLRSSILYASVGWLGHKTSRRGPDPCGFGDCGAIQSGVRT